MSERTGALLRTTARGIGIYATIGIIVLVFAHLMKGVQ